MRSQARNTKVVVVVDIEALRRGHTEGDETCEIQGVGPVPVDTARRLLGDAALAIVIKNGVNVMNVTHLGRNLTAHQQTVVEWWGLRCEVKGCDGRDFVDVHHLFEYVRSGHTRLDELRVYCKHHHRAEHAGWTPNHDTTPTTTRPTVTRATHAARTVDESRPTPAHRLTVQPTDHASGHRPPSHPFTATTVRHRASPASTLLLYN